MFKPTAHTVPKLFAALTSISSETGTGSVAKKVNTISRLIGACQGNESKYLIRSLEGKLRIGLAQNSVVVSLAHAMVLSENLKKGKKMITDREELKEEMERGVEVVKQVFSELPNFELVCSALLEKGWRGLREVCKLTPGEFSKGSSKVIGVEEGVLLKSGMSLNFLELTLFLFLLLFSTPLLVASCPSQECL